MGPDEIKLKSQALVDFAISILLFFSLTLPSTFITFFWENYPLQKQFTLCVVYIDIFIKIDNENIFLLYIVKLQYLIT